MKTITLELSGSSIDKAIEELKAYQKSLPDKMETLKMRLAELGEQVIGNVLHNIPESDMRNFELDETLETGIMQEGNTVKIILHGQQAAFVEFSTGIRFGISGGEYPTPAGAGFGKGTYPGNGHWNDPNGWWYKDRDNPEANERGYVHTWGNRAYMPVYHAEEAIMLEMVDIAKEVFGGN